MRTKAEYFAPLSAFMRNPNPKGTFVPVCEIALMISVTCGKLGSTVGGAAGSGPMPVTEPNSGLRAGHPACESVTACDASAAPNTRAEDAVT